MSLYQMAGEPRIEGDRALEVDTIVHPQQAQIRPGNGFRAYEEGCPPGHVEPGHRQADAVNSNALAQREVGKTAFDFNLERSALGRR